jgi:hypothetical protein
MKMCKCSESTCTGSVSFIIWFILLTAAVSSIEAQTVPFKEGTQYLSNQFWVEDNSDYSLQDKPEIKERKSPSKAFFYSLLLPGTGEAYVGKKTQSKVFLAIEIVAWGLVVANIINVNMRENDYKNFAVAHASVNRTGKDTQFWIDIGKFDTIYEYNEERIRERDIDAIYPENNFYYWGWDKTDNRLFYDSKRIETRQIEQDRLYFFGAIALNHLVSAINALRLANAYNKNIDELSFKFDFQYDPQISQFSLSLQTSL